MSDLRLRLGRAFDFAASQVKATIERTPDYIPSYTREGRWKHGGDVWTDWTSGFFPGMIWRIAEHTKSPDWRASAEHYSRLLQRKQHDRSAHDLGFIFLSAYLPWYRLTQDPAILDVVANAGRSLAAQYNAKGKFLRSHVGADSLLIDVMMNVPLVFHAAIASGDQVLYDQAIAHCETTAKILVRPGGDTPQEAIIDPNTGAFLRHSTQQGYAQTSVWARGLTWAISGFASVYTLTSDPQFLEVAERCANFYLSQTAPGEVPPWDFNVPQGPERFVDSSAGAIAASALLNLAELTDDPQSSRYRTAAIALLDTLCTDQYMAWSTPDWEGVLLHGVYHVHKKLGVDESTIWGDYYFLEAVTKALRTVES